MAEERPDGEPVDYVVVVHGMGRQRRHASLVKVIHRFAEACQGEGTSLTEGMVTLAATRPGSPWIEFEGIPARGRSRAPFTARESDSGDNLRFTDLYWSPLTDEAVRDMADPADEWVRAIAARVAEHQEALRRQAESAAKARKEPSPEPASPAEARRPRFPRWRRRGRPAADGPPPAPAGFVPASVPFWLSHLIRLCRTLIRVIRPVLQVARPALAREIFDEYLGDVQVYCESRELRSRAIGRFHGFVEALVRIHGSLPKEQGGGRPARITVLAHSLGSVLAVDALLFLHLRHGRAAIDVDACERERRATVKRIFASWGRKRPEAVLDKDLGASIHALVTLGCPLEKVIALWPRNHEYHELERNGAEAREQRAPHPRIRHLNFVDAMDIVADPLVTLRSSPLYEAVFEARAPGPSAPDADVAPAARPTLEWDYCFEPTPFAAHATYASDPRLFSWIRDEVWGPAGRERGRFPWTGGRPALDRLVHAQLPVLGGVTAALVTAAVLMAQSIGTAALAACALFGTLFVGGTALRLVGWWSCLIEERRTGGPSPLAIAHRPWWGYALRGVAMLGSCVSAILLSFLWERAWIVFVLPLAAAGLGVAWRLARRHEERVGSRAQAGPPFVSPRTRRANAAIAVAASLWVLAALLLLRGGVPSDLRTEMGGTFELAVVAGVAGLSSTWFGRASALPPSVQPLRGHNPGAFLRTWGFAAYGWGALYLVGCLSFHVALADRTAIAAFARLRPVAWVADAVPAGVAHHPDALVCLAYLVSTGIWAALLVVKGEQGLARDRMDWARMWARKRMADYVRPDAGRAPSAAGPAPRAEPHGPEAVGANPA